MFTGIIEAVSSIRQIRPAQGAVQLTLSRPDIFTDITLGCSIAVNGICLTVTAFDNAMFTVEMMNETLQKTTAKGWKTGDKVNLERAMSLNSRLDGHWVQGHVDTVSTLLESKTVGGTLYLTYQLPESGTKLIAPQGSIAIDGVSVTVAELKANRFSIALITHTISNTILPLVPVGGKVNLEYDIIGKYILRQTAHLPLTPERLHENGF